MRHNVIKFKDASHYSGNNNDNDNSDIKGSNSKKRRVASYREFKSLKKRSHSEAKKRIDYCCNLCLIILRVRIAAYQCQCYAKEIKYYLENQY